MNVIKVICVGNCNAKKTQLLGVLSDENCKYDVNELADIHNIVKNHFSCNIAITANSNLEILIFSTEDTVSTSSNTLIYIIRGKLFLIK